MRRAAWRASVPWMLGAGGVALLLWLGREISWGSLGQALAAADPRWLAASAGLAALSVSARALRLRLLLQDGATYPQVWRSAALGYFGSLFLPLGSGEVVKLLALRREAGLSAFRAAAAVGLDRIFDLAALAALALIAAGAGLLPGLAPAALFGAAAGLALLLTGVLYLALSGDRLEAWALRWGRGRPGRSPWVRRMEDLHRQARKVMAPWLLGRLGLLQAAIFALDLLSGWGILLSFPFGHALPAVAPVRLALFTMLGFGLPLLPGGLGSHQAATRLALGPLGVDPSSAMAVSLAGEALHFLVLATLGGLAAAWAGFGPAGILKQGRMLDSSHPPEAP